MHPSAREQMQQLLDSLSELDDGLTPVMRTACSGAGMRAAECELIPHPLIDDPVAKLLAGSRGYRTGRLWMELVLEQEGTGRHIQVAARARILDDEVFYSLAGLAVQQPNAPVLQVCAVRCGENGEDMANQAPRDDGLVDPILCIVVWVLRRCHFPAVLPPIQRIFSSCRLSASVAEWTRARGGCGACLGGPGWSGLRSTRSPSLN